MKRGARTALLALCVVLGRPGAAEAEAPDTVLLFHGQPGGPDRGTVDLRLDGRSEIAPGTAGWQSVFPVFAGACSSVPATGGTPMLGSYRVLSDRVRFTPRFPLAPGMRYCARADLDATRRLASKTSSSTRGTGARWQELEFAPPSGHTAPAATVSAVYPSADVLPENTLRLYVAFSGPMQRGWAKRNIVLYGADGRPVPKPFLNLSTELWDPGMRRLTLLFDPGRLKRGVGPNLLAGAPLHSGQTYTLVVGPGLRDATGHTLTNRFTKTFQATAAVRERVDPSDWTRELPTAGTRQPLRLRFPRPLDRAVLARSIRVVASGGTAALGGTVEIGSDETAWSFTPASAWTASAYRIEIRRDLEDVCGNNAIAAFDAKVGSSDGGSTGTVSGGSKNGRGAGRTPITIPIVIGRGERPASHNPSASDR